MRDTLTGVRFISLAADDYLTDFSVHFDRLQGDLWKLERRQEFQEPGYPSWDAFAAGRVAESLSLVEAERAEISEYQRTLLARGVRLNRVRVVARPPTRYLWWEAQVLRLRAEVGEHIRALDVSAVSDLEAAGWTLPEAVTLGTEVMYLVQYDENGVLAGAHKYEEADLVLAWVQVTKQLFERAEPFADYFRQEMKDEPEPPVSGA